MLSERLQQLKIHIKQFSAQVGQILQGLRWYIILAYGNALSIFTKKAFPQEYAKTQYNLGITYWTSPMGKHGAKWHRAITAFENALRIFTEEDFPQEYAKTQYLLGVVYLNFWMGSREENLEHAIRSFENVLHIYTEEAFPQDYARTQRNLGFAYWDLLTVDHTGDHGENLHHTITTFENALQIFTKTAFPEEYAIIQPFLSFAYMELLTGKQEKYLHHIIMSFENILLTFENLNDWRDYYKTLEILSQQSIEKIRKISQKDQFGTYLYLLKAIHSFLHEQYYEAIQYLEKFLQQPKDSAYKVVTAYIYLAKAYQAIFEIQKAKWYWKDALNVAKHINNKYLLDFVSVNLAQVEIQFGQIERAKERLHGISKDNGFADSVNQLLAACDTIEQQKKAFAL